MVRCYNTSRNMGRMEGVEGEVESGDGEDGRREAVEMPSGLGGRKLSNAILGG